MRAAAPTLLWPLWRGLSIAGEEYLLVQIIRQIAHRDGNHHAAVHFDDLDMKLRPVCHRGRCGAHQIYRYKVMVMSRRCSERRKESGGEKRRDDKSREIFLY
jgi:hypothetical protein